MMTNTPIPSTASTLAEEMGEIAVATNVTYQVIGLDGMVLDSEWCLLRPQQTPFGVPKPRRLPVL